MIAVDTNLLIYAHREAVPQHDAARGAIEHAAATGRGWGIALASVAEFWSVVTHPESIGGPSSGEVAMEFIEALVATGGCQVWYPQPGFREHLTRMGADLGIQGARIYDLQIGLTALENGAVEVWTHDRGFIAVPGLALHDPLDEVGATDA